VTTAPAALHVVSDVTTCPSANVWTERWLDAAVRQLAAPLLFPLLLLLGLFGDPPPPLHAIAPAHTRSAPRA
jgi:hypothetical protein